MAGLQDSSKATGTHKFEDNYISRQSEIRHQYRPSFKGDSEIPLVIDNGSYRCRAGWANDKEPKLNFRNLVTRQRSKKDGEIQIGNNVSNLEAVRWLLRTQFDKDIVTHFDIQEQIFDYIFHHLGIESDGQIEHPVIVTETLCNPNYSRHLMTELLFECYQVPQLAYGIDSLFSFYQNMPVDRRYSDGLVVSFGYHNTCVLPYLDGRLDADRCRRVNIGGSQQAALLHRVLQLKYPGHLNSVNISRVEELLSKFGYVAKDFPSELRSWSVDSYYQDHVKKIQLPFTPVHSWSDDTKQASFQKLSKEIEEIIKMWNKQEESNVAALQNQWTEFQAEVLQSFEDLLQTLNKWNSLAAVCVSQLQEGIKLLKEKADSNMLHDWLEGLKGSYHNLCENRSDWLNQKELLRQKFLIGDNEEGDEKEDGQEIDTEDLSELEMKKKLQVALENLEEQVRPDEEESKKVAALEQLLRDIEAVLNSHSNQKRMTFDLAEYYQLHFGSERIRVPEILFQPSIIGVEQGGITETIEFILTQYNADLQSRLVKNVFLTGAVASYPNMVERFETELRAMRPFQSTFKVTRADDPILDAWRGAAKWGSNKDLFKDGAITKADYLERGGEYLKEHVASNRYYPTPVTKR